VGVGVAAVQTRSRPPDDGIREVKEIYRETVMAVPHYEEDYGESLRTNLAAEFGEELGHAIESGDRFTPQLKQALIAEADDARDRRRQLLRALDDERSALDDYEAALEELDDRAAGAIDRPLYRRTFAELYDAWHDLEALEAECDDLVARRQAELDGGRPAPSLHRDREAFHSYLYGDLEVDYPVLAAGTTVLDRLRETKRTVLSALTRRV
jgi:regulator of sirC expression with transglutaminase-like and TPR domain